MSSTAFESDDCYGIGAVSSRTGLTTASIRMWEKRYGAVVPFRSATNRRLYSRADIQRLTLLRALCERGHRISNLAKLDNAQLQARLDDAPPTRKPVPRCPRLLLIGSDRRPALSGRILGDAQLVGCFGDLDTAKQEEDLPACDILVIEQTTLFPEVVSRVQDLVKRASAARVLLLYRFGSSRIVSALHDSIPGLSLLAAPTTDRELQRECLVHLNDLKLLPTFTETASSGPVPERLYSPEELSRLARMPSAVECECPQHLAGLLQGLSAFESYSQECEDRNPQDALLHALLHRTTAHARRSMEEALRKVIEIEGIELS